MPTDISNDVEQILSDHASELYNNVCGLFNNRTKTDDDFTRLYKEAHTFVTSEEHVSLSSRLTFSNKPQKLSTKLYFWLIDQNIKKLANKVLQPQEEQINNPKYVEGISNAAKSKVRYIAGACIHKFIGRLRTNVLKNIGKGGEVHQLQRQWHYRSFRLLKTLRISEDEAKKITEEPGSMYEIDYKQGPSRGLLHIPDSVYHFFLSVNSFLLQLLSPSAFHFYREKIYTVVRHKLFANEKLLELWMNLFNAQSAADDEGTDEDELYILMVSELFQFV